jgi:alkyl hydroperoxide reductase subunit AhpC
MKNTLKKILTLSALVTAPFALAADVKEAPDFTLTDIQGNTHTLSDYAGQPVVLEWLNHGCPFVVKFYSPGKMQSLQEKWTGEGVIWLVVNSTHASHRDYLSPEAELAKANEVGSRATAILHDTDGEVGRAYGARTTPHMFVIDAEGNIVYNGAIDSVRSTNSADIDGATNYVDAALTSLMAGEPIEVTTSRPYGCSVKFEGVR